MGAREKLNQAHLNGALVIAAVFGVATQSWSVFWLAVIFIVGSSLYAGDIRPHSRRPK